MNQFIVSHTSRIALAFSLLISLPTVLSAQSEDDFLSLDLEDLLSIEVTSVSKKKQKLSEVASAVFVITEEDIHRSGVTSIPEALRMAPGIQVARFDGNKWAISARGFNGQNANKLLVLIDGRTVYTPSYSGVYWDTQDTLLEDVSRIEVIRGPGATLWGANAVNGVINIITKFASDSQGGMVTAGGGNQEQSFSSLRYGAELSDTTQGRFYLKSFKRDSNKFAMDKTDAHDDWESFRVGFRVDGNPVEEDSWTVQGDFYNTDVNQPIAFSYFDPLLIDLSTIDPATPPGTVIPAIAPGTLSETETTGWNLMARWNHTFNQQSSASLQVYYDKTDRDEFYLRQQHETLDLEFQHQFSLNNTHEFIWGIGYRTIKDNFEDSFLVQVIPNQGLFELYSLFIQDQIELVDDTIYLILGSKTEHNDSIGLQTQPSIRTLWKVSAKSSLWGSVSKAFRTPSRIEKDSRILSFSGVVATGSPLFPFAPISATVNGNKDMVSEELIAYELGYRVQPLENLSVDLSIFFNDYEKLQTFEQIDTATLMFDNKMAGDASGLELAIDWRVSHWLKIQSNYSYIKLSLELNDDSQDPDIALPVAEGSSPENQLSIRSSLDLAKDWQLDLWVYYVDKLKASGPYAFRNDIVIDDYTSLNFRLGWKPKENLELSIVGQNLQNASHMEAIGEQLFGLTATEIERSVYAKVNWNF